MPELLAALGPTQDAVAEALRAARCRGVRMTNDACPVARYLRRHGYPDAEVDGCRVQWDMVRRCVPPEPVRDFIEHFDYGSWPDLDTERGHHARD